MVRDMSRAIGIDLGTTYSCAAIVEGGQPKVIRSRLGYATIPSVVSFDEKGGSLVGQLAERRMALAPNDTIYGHKRLLGRAFLKGVLDVYQPHFQYQLVADSNGLVAARVAGGTVPLAMASALILREIRRAAEESLGEKVDRAVVTVPAYFNENQRAVVREAGRLAHLNVIRIINEPTAAALCFGLHNAEKRRLLVFDLGGGTFDVSIVALDANTFTVEGTDGDTFLGGLDFDARLAAALHGNLEKHRGGSVVLDAVSRQRLRMAAQDCKHQLSIQERAVVQLAGLRAEGGESIDLHDNVTREQFEAVTKDLVDRTIEVVERSLVAARLGPRDINEVLLVGGQTRMPTIQRRLKEMFGKEPTKKIHPDEVVALGAAIAADSHDRFDSAVLLDVVPLGIGIADVGGKLRVIIPRNTLVPHEATTVVQIPAAAAGKLKVAVFQGNQPFAVDNEYLGMLEVHGLGKSDRSQSAKLHFALDAECLLKVRVAVAGVEREVALATQQTPDAVLADLGQERIRAVSARHSLAPLRVAKTPPPARLQPAAVRAAKSSWWSRLVAGLFRR